MSDEAGTDGEPDHKGPLDHTLDVCVFAPIGMAMTAREDLPGLVNKGRDRVEQEISNARVAGEYVIGRLQRRLSERLGRLWQSGDDARPDSPPTASTPVPTPAPSPARAAPDAADSATVGAALVDYDTLSASQVVRRLESLGPDELHAVQRYEAATRNRRTILNRAAQLLEQGQAEASSG